ncbi:MAG: LptF/LptG family permease [Bacteroidales bacterium]|nr:LptF/LptG family permease [Bacteroidales bacterium]MCF8403650.1 LptF/LptG family permease [Bacteroidales bacterium]
MKKIDIYIIKKFLGTFFFAIALLILIVIVFDISEKIDDFLEKQASLYQILFEYYLNFIPYFVNLFSYLFTFIAVIFFTSKMASNSEIVAILSSGISFRRFLFPYLLSAVFLGLMSFYLANFLIPKTNKKMMAFEKTYLKNPYRNRDRNIHMQIKPGTFVYMESYDNRSNTGYKFSLEQYKNNRLEYKLISDRILWDSVKGEWSIKNYTIRKIYDKDEKLIKGDVIDTLLNMYPQEFTFILDDMKTMNFSELRAFIEKERLKGSKLISEYEVEKHKRIAFPFATIILTLIGVSISSRKVRGGIGMHLGFGLGITFGFILFQQVTTVFATRGSMAPWLSVWIPNMIFGVVAIFLYRIAPK